MGAPRPANLRYGAILSLTDGHGAAELYDRISIALAVADLDREGDWATLADALNSCLREAQLPEIAPAVEPIKDGICSLLYKLNRTMQALAAAEHDIHSYRGALGYAVPGDHDGRLSDGTLPVNGIAEAASAGGRRHARGAGWT